jgi:DNA repair protein RadC
VGELLDATPDRLRELGLGPAARRRLLAGAELARRYQPAARPARPVDSPRDALAHLGPLRTAASEVLAVLPLDGRLAPLGGLAVVAVGSLTHVSVEAREVFAPAFERRAAAVVLAHNHPSGTSEPSREDVVFTGTMSAAGAVLGIQVLDHIVVARRGYFSFREAGLMGGPTCRAALPRAS